MTYLIPYIFLGLPLLAPADEQPTCFESVCWGNPPKQTYCQAAFGHRDGRIAFVFFQTRHGTPSKDNRLKHLTIKSHPTLANICEGWIELPDGTKKDLPSSKIAFEFTDDSFHSAPVDLSLDEFFRYLHSIEKSDFEVDPKGLTVESLKKFETKLRTKLSNKSVEPTPTR